MANGMPAGFPGYQTLPAYVPAAPPVPADDDSDLWLALAAVGGLGVVTLGALAWHVAGSARERAEIRREARTAAADLALYRTSHALEHVAIAEAQAARDAAIQAQIDDLTAVSPFAAAGLPSVRAISRFAALAQPASRAPTLRSAVTLPAVSRTQRGGAGG